MVRVDPERRCSVMLIYGTHLVVLPFRQEGMLEEQDVSFTGRYMTVDVMLWFKFFPGSEFFKPVQF